MAKLHLVKLCVGIDSVEHLLDWRAQNPQSDGFTRHVTRMWPKREAELLEGGSLYWVIKGHIQARQTILRLDEVNGSDGIRRCAIVMSPELMRTATARRRPFQGWRYLNPDDAPPDIGLARAGDDSLPASMRAELADIGVI